MNVKDRMQELDSAKNIDNLIENLKEKYEAAKVIVEKSQNEKKELKNDLQVQETKYKDMLKKKNQEIKNLKTEIDNYKNNSKLIGVIGVVIMIVLYFD